MAGNYPFLKIDLDAILENARAVTSRCSAAGIAVAGVTKGVCGSPHVARMLVEGGVRQIADSRIENLARLRNNGIRVELMLLRLPMPSEADQVVRLADISLNSELPVIQRLSDAALRAGRKHKVVIMVELGDLREGVDPEEAVHLALRISELQGVHLAGVGANLTCYGGVVPTGDNLGVLADIAGRVEQAIGFKLEIVSGGNTSSLPLILAGRMPPKINHVRLGESLLLGLNTLDRRPLEGLRQDAFEIRAEVIEVRTKGTVPVGQIAQDAFGKVPEFHDRGNRRRAIAALGREDILLGDLAPVDPGVAVLGASSDHLILDVHDSSRIFVPGDALSFRPGYGALLAAMTSSYVAKRYERKRCDPVATLRQAALIGAPSCLGSGAAGIEKAPAIIRAAGIQAALERAGWSLSDVGDLPCPAPCHGDASVPRNLNGVVAFNEMLADTVARELSGGRAPIVLGGDHSISLGAIAGVRRVRQHLAAVFFSAHADFNTDQTSQSKNIHGMVLSACVGLGHRKLVECGGIWPKFEQESLAMIGVREIDPEEREALKRSRVLAYTMEEIDYLGIREVVECVLREFARRVDGIHVSFAMDALDPAVAPAVSSPVQGGISAREAYLAMEIIGRSGVPISMDIVELNPERDQGGMTAKLAAGLVAALFGKRIL